MPNIATITNNVISALSGTTSQVLLGDATLTDFKLDSLTDVNVPTPGDGDVLRWNATSSLWEASDAAGITGSGTTNYIPKFTPNGGTLGNSSLFDDGTNIGFGTATPENISATKTLTISGSTGGGAISFQVGSVRTGLINGNDNYLTLQSYASRALSLGYNGNNTLVISTSNNVGIGTTSPTAVLQIVRDGGASSIRLLQLDNSNPTYSQNVFLDMNTSKDVLWGQGSAGGGTFWNAGTRGYGWSINGTRIVTYDLNGNVGVGTSTPSYKLHVVGSFGASTSGVTLEFNSGILYHGGSYYQFPSGSYYNIYGRSGMGLIFGSNNTEVGRFDLSGNFGIGTTSPSAKLHMNGEMKIGGDTGAANARLTRINFVRNIYDPTGVGASIDFYRQSSGSEGALAFSTNPGVAGDNAVERMRINAAGFVGIGTTAPQTALDVSGSVRVSGTGGTGFFTGSNVILETAVAWGNVGGSAFQIRNTTSLGLVFGAATSQLMTLTTSGNLGIGITAPTRKLQINESSANTVGIAITNTSTTVNGLQLLVDGAGGAALWNYSNTELTFGTNNNERLRITSAGNVGIGTTTPGARFSVELSGAANQRLANFRNTGGNSFIEIQSSGAGAVALWAAANNEFGIYQNTTAGTIGTSVFYANSSGNVGIGTTAPAYKLQVAGTLSANAGFSTYITDGVFGATSTPSVINLPNSNNRIIFGYATSGDGIYHGRVGVLSNGTGKVSFGAVASSTFSISTGDTDVERLRILPTGEVGIGTSAPANRLTVIGGLITAGTTTAQTAFLGADGSNVAYVGSLTNHAFQIRVNNTTRIAISTAGFVGIGTTTPTFILDVSGDALINGVRVGKGPNNLSGNTILGTTPLNAVTTGTNNVAIGTNALRGTTTGNYNIAIGTSAGGIGAAENTTGSLNIFIGAECQGESATDSNRTWIGGPTTTSTWLAGNLLLGTKTNSTYRLDVVGTGRITNGLYVSGGIVAIQTLASGGTTIVVADSAGNLSTQPTSTYLSSLSGEATNSGSVVTLTNSAVIGKVLTGLNITSAAITASDSILSAFGKIQGQIDGLQGGTIYKGSWNASTNTPTITSSTGTQGHYYVVTTAGTTNINGVSSWAVGDWIIFNGTIWEKIPNVDAITSVNGQTGVVSLTTSNISEGTNLYYTDARARAAISLTTSGSSGASTYSSGVLNIPTYTLVGLGGVSTGTTITINGVSQDLSTNRTYNVGTVTSIGLAVPTGFTASSAITSSGNITLGFATGYALPTTASQANWDAAYNDRIVSAAVSGTTTKTLTLTQQDSGTITASWTDINTDAVTSVFGRTGAVVAVSGDYTTAQVTESGNLYYTDARARAAISLTTTGTTGAATYSGGVLNIPNYSLNITYNNNSDASYQMLWGSGNAIYGTSGITCNPFTDSINLSGTLFTGGITVTGFGRMYGGDFWHSGTANNGTRTETFKLGRFSDSETPAYVIYTDDTNGDILEFYSNRYTGDFRLTRNSETGLRNTMRVNSDNGGSVIDLYTGDGTTLGAKIQSTGDARFAYDVVAYYSFSDARLKTNVLTIENPLQKVMAMRGVTYEWKEGYKAGKKEIGLIAQEVMDIIPEVVSEKERVDGRKFLSVDYEHLTGLLIEAVKELKKEVDELKSK